MTNKQPTQQTTLRFPRNKATRLNSQQMMQQVILALVPGLLLQSVWLGIGVIIQVSLGILTAFCCEWFIAKCRHRNLSSLEWQTGVISAMLLGLSIPAYAPWYVIICSVSFAIIVGKHLFGGIGMNIFNPAMLGFCVAIISFPQVMALWPQIPASTSDAEMMLSFSQYFSQHFIQQISLIFHPAAIAIDAKAGATVLGLMKAEGIAFQSNLDTLSKYQISMAITWLITGGYLCYRRIADWRLSATLIASFALLIFLLSAWQHTDVSLLSQLLNGALIFTAFFIITDPVTAATSRQGRIIYAMLVAVVAVIIRLYSNMPDGFAFAILFANMCVPLIDEYTKPTYAKLS